MSPRVEAELAEPLQVSEPQPRAALAEPVELFVRQPQVSHRVDVRAKLVGKAGAELAPVAVDEAVAHDGLGEVVRDLAHRELVQVVVGKGGDEGAHGGRRITERCAGKTAAAALQVPLPAVIHGCCVSGRCG